MAGFKPRPLISEASALATESQPTPNDDFGAFFFKTSGVRRDIFAQCVKAKALGLA